MREISKKFKALVEFLFGEKCQPNCYGGPSNYRARGVRNRRYPDFALLPSADAVLPVSSKWLVDSILTIRSTLDPVEKKKLQIKFDDIYDRADDMAGFMRDGNHKSRYGIRYTHEHKNNPFVLS